MGRRRPDWWSEQQQQQQQQQHRRQQQDSPVEGCPRNAANARERARMRVLSRAFGRLKTTLPWVPADTKLSKLDTLRLATTYIAHLSTMLATSERQPNAAAAAVVADRVVSAHNAQGTATSSPPQNYAVTWPYNTHSTVKECSSPEDDYNRYDCYSTLENKSYSTYDAYYMSSINS